MLITIFFFLPTPERVFPNELNYQTIVWNYFQTLCHLGPRFPGSKGHGKTRELIIETGKQFAGQTLTQKFSYHPVNGGEPISLMNIEFRFGLTRERPLLIGTHYDTRPRADEDSDPSNRNKPILGANDGGSGTALLLGLAQALHKKPPSYPVSLVFFDGEDFGRKGSVEYLLGSEYYAKQIGKEKIFPKPLAVLIVDMVGDRQLEIYRESYSMKSAPRLMDQVFSIARQKNGFNQFKDEVRHSILDDHMPFGLLGIPAMVLIDFDYPYWHTLKDTPEKCSQESLMAVFKVLNDLIEEWSGN